MRVHTTVIGLLLLIMLNLSVLAQKKPSVHNHGKSTYTRERFNYNATRVKGSKAKIVCPVFENSKYPYHGLGLKLGDPFAATYKFYPNKNYSFAVDFGKAASGLYNRYFREKFNSYQNLDSLSENASLTYLSHKVKSDFIGEVKFLYHLDAKKISAGLQVYAGLGWEWKNSKVQYDYVYEREPSISDPEPENTPGRFVRSRFTHGPQAVIGIEYSYFQLPISAFMELEYFADVHADPGWRRTEGGVGLRYIF
jgi:hypothetical protein